MYTIYNAAWHKVKKFDICELSTSVRNEFLFFLSVHPRTSLVFFNSWKDGLHHNKTNTPVTGSNQVVLAAV